MADKRIDKIEMKLFVKKWLKRADGKTYFDFNGALFPDIRHDAENWGNFFHSIFEDTFFMSCYCGDNYDKSGVDILDKLMGEGPYGYTDKDSGFDVTVKKADIVIDADAWCGDFSAYAASKGAQVYAFEPTKKTFGILTETAELNGNNIIPVNDGLGADDFDANISINLDGNSGGNSTVIKNSAVSEKIHITTIDKFVAENGIERIDFIKADIEGAERDMLKGAKQTLQKFAPKLALCTYHLHDDPEVLSSLILEANPKYRIVHLRKKLFACV
jgi:FkbM family methyltransferase